MGNEGQTRVEMTQRSDGVYVARIPVVGDANTSTDVAYQIVALAPSMAELGQVGTTAEPLQLRIPAEARVQAPSAVESAHTPAHPTPPPRGENVAEQWWFWTLIVVVLAGGAVTAGVLISQNQDGPEAGTLGIARLMSIELP
jgi:hypothetical protein